MIQCLSFRVLHNEGYTVFDTINDDQIIMEKTAWLFGPLLMCELGALW
jgi:hypothetical protein